MPLKQSEKKVKKAMEHFYGKKKGDQVFYAWENKHKLNK